MANTAGGAFTVVTLTPALGYQLTGRLGVRVRVPVHWKSFVEAGPGLDARRSGLGDLELLGGYELVGQSRWRLHATAGVALPTGDTVPQPFVGDVAPTPLQLGGGTFDPAVGLTAGYEPGGPWSAGATAAARLALYDNADAYRSASVIEVGVGGAYAMWDDRVRVQLRSELSEVTHVRVAGARAPNTGRRTLFGSLATRARLLDDLAVELTVRAPLYLRVNETQLTEDVLLSLRLTYTTGAL